jgi:AraC-like DNA-binding protein
VQGSLLPEQGTARIWPVSANLVKLQFFIDQALPSRPEHVSVPGLVVLPAPQAQVLASGSLERWYLTQALQPNVAGQGLAQALRRRESYQLLEFLNEHAVSGCKLHELAERYGVSVSHFRRLCRQALGSRSKTVLRDWRAARALLAVANGPANLTEVAMHCGYASSSHFSRDIRQILGVMPSSLQDITRLA